jgi:hypothetical protein
VGGWKIAAYGILPPLAGYLLMLAVWWASPDFDFGALLETGGYNGSGSFVFASKVMWTVC